MRRSEPKDLNFLRRRAFAHRGLHMPGGAVENSFAAFDRAIEGGFGIELDVRLTADRGAAVFHDKTLDRLTDREGNVADHTLKELAQITLKGTGEPIHSLREAIVHIRGRVPLLIEIKSPGRRGGQALCRAIRRSIEGANGWAAIMSFDPRIVAWFGAHSPRIVRGLVITEHGEPRTRGRRGWLARKLALRKARPHFLAYDIRSLPAPDAERFRKTGGAVLTWTVRSKDEQEHAKTHADQTIFEQDPKTPA